MDGLLNIFYVIRRHVRMASLTVTGVSVLFYVPLSIIGFQAIPDSAMDLEFRGHQSGPSLNDRSSEILMQYPSPHDHSNLGHSEPPKFQVDGRVRYNYQHDASCQMTNILSPENINNPQSILDEIGGLEAIFKDSQNPLEEAQKFLVSFISEINFKYGMRLTVEDAFHLARENICVMQVPDEEKSSMLAGKCS